MRSAPTCGGGFRFRVCSGALAQSTRLSPEVQTSGPYATLESMKLWRLSISDGKFGKPGGTALAWAKDAQTARQTVEQELASETAYGEPFVIADAHPYDDSQPHVVVINWD